MKLTKKLTVIALGSVFLTACVNTDYQSNVYQQSDLQQAQVTTFGTIESLREITIKQDEGITNPLLTIAGTAAGAIGGSHIGGGSGKILGAIGGGLLGGYATNAAVSGAQLQKGVEFTIRKTDGQLVTFGQQGNINNYHTGQRVKLITNNGKTKIVE